MEDEQYITAHGAQYNSLAINNDIVYTQQYHQEGRPVTALRWRAWRLSVTEENMPALELLREAYEDRYARRVYYGPHEEYYELPWDAPDMRSFLGPLSGQWWIGMNRAQMRAGPITATRTVSTTTHQSLSEFQGPVATSSRRDNQAHVSGTPGKGSEVKTGNEKGLDGEKELVESDGDPSHRPNPDADGRYYLVDTNKEEGARKIAWSEGTVKAALKKPGVDVDAVRIPRGYAYYGRIRESDNGHGDDFYLYGHPSHHPFNSGAQFAKHYQYLLKRTTDKESGGSRCNCEVCKRFGSSAKQ